MFLICDCENFDLIGFNDVFGNYSLMLIDSFLIFVIFVGGFESDFEMVE